MNRLRPQLTSMEIPNSNRLQNQYQTENPSQKTNQNSNSYRKPNIDQITTGPINFERRDFYGPQTTSNYTSTNSTAPGHQSQIPTQTNQTQQQQTSQQQQQYSSNIGATGTLRSYLNSFENLSSPYDRNGGLLSNLQSPNAVSGLNTQNIPSGTSTTQNPSSNSNFTNGNGNQKNKNLTIETATQQPVQLNGHPQSHTGGSSTVANSMMGNKQYNSNFAHGTIYSATNSSAPIFGTKQSAFLSNLNGMMTSKHGNEKGTTNDSKNNNSINSSNLSTNLSGLDQKNTSTTNDSGLRDQSPTQRQKLNNFMGPTSTSLQMPFGTGNNSFQIGGGQNQRKFVNTSINLKESSIQNLNNTGPSTGPGGIPMNPNDWRSPKQTPSNMMQSKNNFSENPSQKMFYPTLNMPYPSHAHQLQQSQQLNLNIQPRESNIFGGSQSKAPTTPSVNGSHTSISSQPQLSNTATTPSNNNGSVTSNSTTNLTNQSSIINKNMSEVIAQDPVNRSNTQKQQNQEQPLNPKDQQFFDNLLDKNIPLPNQEPTQCSFKRNGIVKAYAANTNQGLVRNYNEDRVSIILNIMKPSSRANEDWPKCSFFGVYDGHGGVNCADFLRDNLHQYVIREQSFPWNPKEALKNGFLAAEKQYIEIAQSNPSGIDRSGSCAIVVLIVGDMCYVANVGDSRAVLSGDWGQKVYTLSRDHKPTDQLEQKRIISGGGKIYQTQAQTVKQNAAGQPQTQILLGPMRVFPGRLSVSRTFGDIQAKLQKLGGNPNVVVSEPEIKSFRITDDHDFIVIASDGIYDKMNSADVVQSVWDSATEEQAHNIHKQCGFGVDHILRESLNKRSLDNVTVVMVSFANFKRKIFGVKNKDKKKPLEEININIPLNLTHHGNNNNGNGEKPATAHGDSENKKRPYEQVVTENSDIDKKTPNSQSDVRKSNTLDTRGFGPNTFVYNSNNVTNQTKKKNSERNPPNNQNSFTNIMSKDKTQLQQHQQQQAMHVNGSHGNVSQHSPFNSNFAAPTSSGHYSQLRFMDQQYYDIPNKPSHFTHNLQKR